MSQLMCALVGDNAIFLNAMAQKHYKMPEVEMWHASAVCWEL